MHVKAMKVRYTGGTYVARITGQKVTASCTISARDAAVALARKIGVSPESLEVISTGAGRAGDTTEYSYTDAPAVDGLTQEPLNEPELGNELPSEFGPPSTIKGLKRRAIKIKRERGIRHTEALEVVARSMGYTSYKSALNGLGETEAGQ